MRRLFRQNRWLWVGLVAVLLLSLGIAGLAQRREPVLRPPHHVGEPVSNLSSKKGAAPPVAQAVTFNRLLRARSEPQNWLTYYGAYDGQRFSALDQIRADNVKQLKPAWVFQYGQIGLNATPATYSWEA